MNTYVLGDVHGAYKALLQCVERSNINKEEDTLIVLGDVCDGWTQVPQCFEELLTFKNIKYIIGNHDQWFIDYSGGTTKNKDSTGFQGWTKQGGQATIDAYSIYPELVIKHLVFLREHGVYYYIDNQRRAFVHGGFNRHNYLINESPMVLMWDRDLWKKALSCKVEKMNFKQEFEHVFIGHTSTTFWGQDIPMTSGGVTNLDTGAGWDGKLTIMNIDTGEYWQSDKVQDLYPEETGRRQ